MPHPNPDADSGPPGPMTYRPGAFVIDTRTATLVQVMGHLGPHVQVRQPGGGREWDVPPEVLRLAGREEREAAGIRGSDSTSPVGCAECAALEANRRAAASVGDQAMLVDTTIAVRSHFRTAHLLPKENAW